MSKYIDGFRGAAAATALRERLETVAAARPVERGPVRIMEVCGSHTMAIGRFGIRDVLPPNIDLLSGPGCPVCVTPTGYIDTAIELAKHGLDIVTFGDMLHVPGSAQTLAACRAEGGQVQACYTPLEALEWARLHPDREVVFLAIGFETTVAPVISLVERGLRDGLKNLSLLTAFKCVPPALEALATDPELRIDAFLCPAHVSAIIGARAYEPFCAAYRKPCVIAGFEPLDILMGLEGIMRQLADDAPRVENQYSRVVTADGNRKAQALMARFLEPVDAHWRGIGTIPGSGLGLREAYAAWDAEKKHGVRVQEGFTPKGCRCGDVIKGKLKPPECPLFRHGCSPSHPIGPCMVSSEGSCAAYFKYSRVPEPTDSSTKARP